MRSLTLRLLLLMAVLLPVLLSSCERRPLEVEVGNKVLVKVRVKWNVSIVAGNIEPPTGMTVRIWGADNKVAYTESTNNEFVYASLSPGTYRMVIFNELPSDYLEGGMSFFDYDNFDRIALRSTHYSRRAGALAAEALHIVSPESPRMGVAVDTFQVSADMVNKDTLIFMSFDDYRNNGYQATQEYEQLLELQEEPFPMTVDLWLKLKVKHHKSLYSMEGSLTGMADGFYLTQVVRTKETGALWFSPRHDNWKRESYGEETDETELLYTKVASYGLPNGKELVAERNEADNVLSLRLTLINGSQYDLSYNVGKNIEYITPEGVERRVRYRQDLQNLQLVVELPDLIDLPEVDPENSGAGFDAKVDEWEDGGTFNFTGF